MPVAMFRLESARISQLIKARKPLVLSSGCLTTIVVNNQPSLIELIELIESSQFNQIKPAAAISQSNQAVGVKLIDSIA